MDFIKDNDFDNYIEAYKKLNLSDKKNLVENEFYEIMIVLQKLCNNNGKHPKVLYNKEVMDIKKEGSTEDDFVEAVFTYCNSIKELLAEFVESIDK